MISAIQTAAYGMERASQWVKPIPAQGLSVSESPVASPAEQTMKVIQAEAENAEAMNQAQISMFRESLDLAANMTQQMINSIVGYQAYQANATVLSVSSRMLDTTA